jgi:predicted metal-dependent enzyme (double-stranded beta helix superfamily)
MSLALHTRNVPDLGGLAEWYAARRDEWAVTPRFDPDRRWYARLAGTGDHEAWLLTWLPGQATELHDHGGSAGAFTVLEGRLTEQLPIGRTDVRFVDRGYGIGATRPFGPRHVHRIVNAGTAPAVSLHVYAPALTRMTRYTLTDGRLEVTAVEREGADW